MLNVIQKLHFAIGFMVITNELQEVGMRNLIEKWIIRYMNYVQNIILKLTVTNMTTTCTVPVIHCLQMQS